MKDGVRAFRLCEAERIFLHGVMSQAIAKAEKKDISICVKYAMRLLHHDTQVRARAKCVLRPAIMEAFEDRGPAMFRKLFERSTTFKMLPKPLKGNQLQAEARRLNILQRSKQARVGAAVIREECALAPIRLKMKMPEEVGRECKRVTMLKTKRKECIKRIVQHAKVTGVADITQVWRDFHDSPNYQMCSHCDGGQITKCACARHSRTYALVCLCHLCKSLASADSIVYLRH
jgi:hypothetical protein